MATSLQNLLSNQFSTQLGSLAAPVDPGAALANIIGGVGKTYTLGEQLKLAEAQDQAEMMRKQQQVEQQRQYEQQQLMQKQNMLGQQAERSKAMNLTKQVDGEVFDLVKKGLLTSEAQVKAYRDKRLLETGLKQPAIQQKVPEISANQQEMVVGTAKPTPWNNQPQAPSEQPDIYEQIAENIPEKADKGLYDSNLKAYELYAGKLSKSPYQLQSELETLDRLAITSEKALNTRGWTPVVETIGQFFPLPADIKEKLANTKLYREDISTFMLKKADEMKGQLSDKDIEFLRGAVASEKDDAKIRKMFINIMKLRAMTELLKKNYAFTTLSKRGQSEILNFPEVTSRIDDVLKLKPLGFIDKSGEVVFTNDLERDIRRRMDRKKYSTDLEYNNAVEQELAKTIKRTRLPQ